KAVWALVEELLPGTLWVAPSLAATKITWYDAVRKCIELTHAAIEVSATVKADMTAKGYTASASDSNCIAYQDTYAPGRKKVYRLLTDAEWMECYNTGKLNSHSQREWVGDAYDSSNRVMRHYDYLNSANQYYAYAPPANSSTSNGGGVTGNIGFRLARIV
ncbi:hypothetical protein NO2_1476, partial [Candidatus Termititenax persephonae]